MNNELNKKFFLLSFLPAIAYWYLEENYPISIAITGGLVLAIIEIILEKVFTKHVHSLSKMNFGLLAFLGCLSLLGDDGIWFKLQPFFTGVGIGAFLLYRKLIGKSFLEEMSEMLGNNKIPSELMTMIESHLCYFFFSYSTFMGVLAFLGTTGQWAFFKTIGFYLAFVVFLIVEIFLMRREMKRLIERSEKQALFEKISRSF